MPDQALLEKEGIVELQKDLRGLVKQIFSWYILFCKF